MGEISNNKLQSEGIWSVKQILLMLMLVPIFAHSQTVALPPGVVKPAYFDHKGIKVVAYQKGVSGLNIWQVEKGSTKTVFYSTPDNKVLMSGVLWDSATGANISDAYITAEMVANPVALAVAVPPAVSIPDVTAVPLAQKDGVFGPKITSEAIKNIAPLVGVKEGRGTIDKTLYIMFDPRCPYCHSVYNKTRAYVKAGGTIKWLPVVVLGDKANGMRLVADILQARDPAAAMVKVLGKPVGVATADANTTKVVQDNEAYFFAAFERNKAVGQAGVPVAFFETKTGEPQMVSGIDDDELLKRILADIKK